MKIILVIANSKGRNVLFINDSLKPLLPEAMAKLIKSKEVSGFSIVKAKTGFYIRTKRNLSTKDNLGGITISDVQLKNGCADYSTIALFPAIKEFEQIKVTNITVAKDTDIIKIEGKPKRTKQEAIDYLKKYKDIISEAANNQKVDVNLLGAILIDEYCRMGWDDMLDWMALLNIDTSISIGQIKTETARTIIKNGYYTPDKTKDLSNASRAVLWTYLQQPKHSVNFASAKMHSLIDTWEPYCDISKKPEIIATLYSLKAKTPHSDPKSSPRGDQIYNEFYSLAKQVFN